MTADRDLASLTRLDGRIALVTGAAAGIGLQIVRRFVEAGATVHAVDRSAGALAAAAAELRDAPVTWHEADVTDAARAAAVVEAAAAERGLDILVNNAGVFPDHVLLDSDAASWRTLAAVNVEGVINFLNPSAQRMIDQGRGGSIINLASVAAFKGSPIFAHYGATKAAVMNLTGVAAVELGPHGVRVNAIAPGGIVTPGMEVAAQQATALAATSARQAPATERPIGRLGTPDDIALAALFLACDQSSYITGATLVADGGSLVR